MRENRKDRKELVGDRFSKTAQRAAARNAKTKPEPRNGVSGRTLFPCDFTHVIPPYLHLILGLVNDIIKELRKDLQSLGNVDPAQVSTFPLFKILIFSNKRNR